MIIHFLFSFLCSILFAIVLTYFMKRKAPGPFGGVLYFFMIIFLFTAALGLLITPVGPMYRNVPWLSILFIALLVMLLIAELLPHDDKAVVVKRKIRQELNEADEDEETLKKEFSIIMVLIMLMLFAAIIYIVIKGPDTFHVSF